MIFDARDYQLEAVKAFLAYFEENTGNPVIAMPTGTGKSIVLAMMLQAVFEFPEQRVMVLTHVKELIQQNYEKLMALWPRAPAGIYSAGLGRRDTHRKITFAGIASVAKRAAEFGKIDLVFIDEAHLVSPTQETMYIQFLTSLWQANQNIKIVGLTATPWRLGQGHITTDGIFTDVCFDITTMDAFNRLIAEGYLAKLIPRRTREALDVNGVHLRGGEFIAAELQLAVDKDEVTQRAIDEALDLAADRNHWLVFASGVEHAIHITEALKDRGVPSVAIHSNLSGKDRDQALIDFKSGKYRVAVNNNILTTGFDFPAIDCIIVLRPTASTVLWVQMLGRGTRPSPATGKADCLVLDFAGNTKRLGPINDPVIPRKKGEKGGVAPVKLCPACDTYNHASVRFCDKCGAEFTFEVKIKSTADDTPLVRGEMPQVAVFRVDHVTYSKHQKLGKPDAIKVAYFCGLRKFNEYVCLEHIGYASRRARLWWAKRTPAPPPHQTDKALEQVLNLPAPTHLRVWINKEYPEITDECFDGTAFGTEQACPRPTTEVAGSIRKVEGSPEVLHDDIPF